MTASFSETDMLGHAIVTGGAGDIGQAIARRLATTHSGVILVDIAGAEAAAAGIPDARAATCDVTDPTALAAIAAAIDAPVSTLVNNAGAAHTASLGATTPETWAADRALNLDAAWYAFEAFRPALLASRGSVVNVASVNGLGVFGHPAYSAAKAGMIYAFGSGGNSSLIVHELQNRLFRLGCRISASSDHAMNLMLAAAAVRGDVVFGSSITGRNAELVRCFRVLQDRGIPTIALTQSRSPVAEAADLVIAVDLPEGVNIFRPTSTRFACLAVIDILANLVAYADRPRSARLLRGIKEQFVRHRDEDDRQLLGD
jgi:D-arabinose 5-phosphate isomerase GutQ